LVLSHNIAGCEQSIRKGGRDFGYHAMYMVESFISNVKPRG
jgi:hypothetical protein